MCVHRHWLYDFYTWYACITAYVGHAVVMFICSMLITARLLQSVLQKAHLLQGISSTPNVSEARAPTKELRASVTVVTLALLQCAAYFPSSVLCMFYCFGSASDMPTTHPHDFADLVVVYDFAFIFCTVGHVWNFFVYVTKVFSRHCKKLFLLRILFIIYKKFLKLL